MYHCERDVLTLDALPLLSLLKLTLIACARPPLQLSGHHYGLFTAISFGGDDVMPVVIGSVLREAIPPAT